MKKFFLAFGYSQKNAGDLAITLGALDLLLSDDFNVVTVLSRYDKDSTEYINSYRYLTDRYGARITVLPAPFKLDRNNSLFLTLLYHFHGFLVFSGILKAKYVRSAIRESDVVVFNGGNLLRCSSVLDVVRLVALYYPIMLAKRFKVGYYILPQSSAEISSIGAPIIKKMLRNAKIAFIREQLSYDKLLKEFRLTNLARSIDLAFFIEKRHSPYVSHEGVSKKIAFTFRAWTVGDIKELTGEEKDKISSFVDAALKSLPVNSQIYFVVQTKKDLPFTKALETRFVEMGRHISVFESYDPVELSSFYSEMDLLFGMRLHSIILAIAAGTPCFGLFCRQWGLKNPGVMNMFGLPFLFLDSENSDMLSESTFSEMLEFKHSFGIKSKQIIEKEREKFNFIFSDYE